MLEMLIINTENKQAIQFWPIPIPGPHPTEGRDDVPGGGLHQRHHRALSLHQTRAQHLGATPETDSARGERGELCPTVSG